MDRPLRREIEAVARDRNSGARELALRTVTALLAWQRRHLDPAEAELLGIARALLRAQAAMAPFRRLANELVLAADSKSPGNTLVRALGEFQTTIETAPGRIATRFEAALEGKRGSIVGTYSYSSTVVHALRKARSEVSCVYCSESRPGLEGRRTARELARAGILTHFVTDAGLASYMDRAAALVVGADAVHESSFINKIGTVAMVSCALEQRKRVWVLADTSKFLPPEIVPPLTASCGPPHQVWADPPKRVVVLNPYFECVPLREEVRILTERGWLSPARVQREVRRIRISPRLKAVAD
ncbi:MAG TPA: hypothetical protein VKE24_09295 [Candidatus Acidoferrales bacterium]|nr:hypothetical protein [Candidatus Acidoferrales bacterium]